MYDSFLMGFFNLFADFIEQDSRLFLVLNFQILQIRRVLEWIASQSTFVWIVILFMPLHWIVHLFHDEILLLKIEYIFLKEPFQYSSFTCVLFFNLKDFA